MTEILQQLDLPSWGAQYAVALLRAVGMFIFLPILGSQMMPMRMRLTIAAALAMTFLPLVSPDGIVIDGPASWVAVGVRELSVGFALGLAARMVFAGIETAAGLVAGQSGFSLASMVDPSSGDTAAAPALFQNLIAMSLFLSGNLHHLFIRAVVRSYELLPPAATLPNVSGLQHSVAALGMRLFDIAVMLAAPALIVTIGVDLVMVLVGKGMPQVPILMVAYPLKMGAGLVAMWILALAVGSAIGWLGRSLAADGAALLQALGAA